MSIAAVMTPGTTGTASSTRETRKSAATSSSEIPKTASPQPSIRRTALRVSAHDVEKPPAMPEPSKIASVQNCSRIAT